MYYAHEHAKNELRRTAIHEAGHCLVAHRRGCPAHNATITTGNPEWLGVTNYPRPRCTVDLIAIVTAGAVAERLTLTMADVHGCAGDQRELDSLLRCAPNADELLRLGRELAEEIIAGDLRIIGRLASELLRRRTLTAKAILRIISRGY